MNSLSISELADEQEMKLSDWFAKEAVYNRIRSALSGWMDAESFIGQLIISFQDPKLKGCNPKSLFEAAHQCAALQLLPTMDHVALIPYDLKDAGLSCKVMPQWQGYKSLMERHPDVLEVTAELVHVRDDYAIVNGSFSHSFDPFDEKRQIVSKADIRGGYVKVTYTNLARPPRFHFLNVHEIEKRRKVAQTTVIWDAWYRQMAIKSLYRDAFQRRIVPVDTLVNLKRLASLDDQAMGHDPSNIAAIGHVSSQESRVVTSSLNDRLEKNPAITNDESTKEPAKRKKAGTRKRTSEKPKAEKEKEAEKEADDPKPGSEDPRKTLPPECPPELQGLVDIVHGTDDGCAEFAIKAPSLAWTWNDKTKGKFKKEVDAIIAWKVAVINYVIGG